MKIFNIFIKINVQSKNRLRLISIFHFRDTNETHQESLWVSWRRETFIYLVINVFHFLYASFWISYPLWFRLFFFSSLSELCHYKDIHFEWFRCPMMNGKWRLDITMLAVKIELLTLLKCVHSMYSQLVNLAG